MDLNDINAAELQEWADTHGVCIKATRVPGCNWTAEVSGVGFVGQPFEYSGAGGTVMEALCDIWASIVAEVADGKENG